MPFWTLLLGRYHTHTMFVQKNPVTSDKIVVRQLNTSTFRGVLLGLCEITDEFYMFDFAIRLELHAKIRDLK